MPWSDPSSATTSLGSKIPIWSPGAAGTSTTPPRRHRRTRSSSAAPWRTRGSPGIDTAEAERAPGVLAVLHRGVTAQPTRCRRSPQINDKVTAGRPLATDTRALRRRPGGAGGRRDPGTGGRRGRAGRRRLRRAPRGRRHGGARWRRTRRCSSPSSAVNIAQSVRAVTRRRRPAGRRRRRRPGCASRTSASPPPRSRATRSSSTRGRRRRRRDPAPSISTQHPHLARDLMAQYTGLEKDAGPAWSRRTWAARSAARPGSVNPHAAVVAAARRLGRPVAWVETRSEAMLSMHGRGQVQYAELGLAARRPDHRAARPDHRRLRRLCRLRRRAGRRADAHHGARAPTRSRGSPTTRDRRADQHRPDRRLPRRRPARGGGDARAAVDLAADELGLDAGGDPAPQPDRQGRLPVPDPHRRDLRRRRLRRWRSTEALRVADVDAAPRRAAAAPRGRRPAPARHRGLRPTSRSPASAAPSSASCVIDPDGSATVMSGTSAHGQGHATSFAMIVADRLGIPIEQIPTSSPTPRSSAAAAAPAAPGRCSSAAARSPRPPRACASRRSSWRPRMLEAGAGRHRGGRRRRCGVSGVAGADAVGWAELAAEAAERDGAAARRPRLRRRTGATFPFGAHVVDGRGRHRDRPGARRCGTWRSTTAAGS